MLATTSVAAKAVVHVHAAAIVDIAVAIVVGIISSRRSHATFGGKLWMGL